MDSARAPHASLPAGRPEMPGPASSAVRPTARLRPRYQPLVAVAFAVAAGIVLDRYGRQSISAIIRPSWHGGVFEAWWLLSLLSLLTWRLLWRVRRDRLALWTLLFSVVLCGAAWHELRWSRFDDGQISRYAPLEPQPVCVRAIALKSPDRITAPEETPLRAIPAGERSRLLINLKAIRDGTIWRPASGVCQLTVNGHLLGVRPDDDLRVFGQLVRPAPPLNPGEFDFAEHARADRQLARLRSSAPESIRVLQAGPALSLSGTLDTTRNACLRHIEKFVGPERAGLAAAILLGNRAGLPYDQTEPYLVTGTIHVLVVSGMNVAILAAGLLGMIRLGWIARRAGLAVIIGIIVMYTLLAELQPPVVRAAVFGVLLCIAAWTGRRGSAFNSLAAAALVVLAINPADVFRPGPQLSFLAVATLICIGNQGGLVPAGPSERVNRLFDADRSWYMRTLARWARAIGWFGRPPDRLERMILADRVWYERLLIACGRTIVWLMFAALAVWLVTLPLVLMHFHIASPVSVLISPAVWLFVFGAMWSGFTMLTLGWLVPAVGALCGIVCDASLAGLQQVVAWAEAIPAGHFWAPGPAWWWVLVFYLALVTGMICGRSLAPPRWQLAGLCAWILVGLVPPVARAVSRDGLECSFVAVGHGVCVVFESPTGETLVYDAGALGSPESATQAIASYLWHRGIMRIDGLVISHADVDHYNAVPGLLERFRVSTVYVSPVMFDGFADSSAPGGVEVLREAIRAAGVPIREIWAGDKLQVGPEVTIEVLHPPRRGVIGSDNANSITLAAEYRGRRVLLPGDLESPGLEDVMAELPFDCDVLLAPHHGSGQSDPPGFAAWSTPEWVVISGAGGDEIEPVVSTYRRAGADVLETSRRGAVQVSLRPGFLRLATWQNPDRQPGARP